MFSSTKQKGFSAVEILGLLFILFIILGVVAKFTVNSKRATEARAYDNAAHFIAKNSLDVERVNCAGDSDGDGYGTCTVKTKPTNCESLPIGSPCVGEKIQLQCETDWWNVNILRLKTCKEQVMVISG